MGGGVSPGKARDALLAPARSRTPEDLEGHSPGLVPRRAASGWGGARLPPHVRFTVPVAGAWSRRTRFGLRMGLWGVRIETPCEPGGRCFASFCRLPAQACPPPVPGPRLVSVSLARTQESARGDQRPGASAGGCSAARQGPALDLPSGLSLPSGPKCSPPPVKIPRSGEHFQPTKGEGTEDEERG